MGFPDWQAFSSGFSEIGNRRPKRELTGVQTVVEMEMGLFYYELDGCRTRGIRVGMGWGSMVANADCC